MATSWFDLQGHVAVVTGALGQLGPVWVEALLEAGAQVAAIDLPEATPSPRFARVQQCYPRSLVRTFAADVTSRPTLEAALARCQEELGAPTILVNNAGVDQPPSARAARARWHDVSQDDCRRILEVNLLGAFVATQVFTAPMIRRRQGVVVNVGSLYASVAPDVRLYDHLGGEVPFWKPPLYGASKAGVVGLSRYLAAHLAPYGLRVNTLSPGGVLGGQDEAFCQKFSARVPLGRLADPDELKGPLVFLASRASAYVTGTELVVDGGFTTW